MGKSVKPFRLRRGKKFWLISFYINLTDCFRFEPFRPYQFDHFGTLLATLEKELFVLFREDYNETDSCQEIHFQYGMDILEKLKVSHIIGKVLSQELLSVLKVMRMSQVLARTSMNKMAFQSDYKPMIGAYKGFPQLSSRDATADLAKPAETRMGATKLPKRNLFSSTWFWIVSLPEVQQRIATQTLPMC